MSKKVINFDFDGVVCDSIKAICDIHTNENHKAIINNEIAQPNPHKVRKWNVTDQIPSITIQDLDRYFTSDYFFDVISFITDPNGFSMKNLFSELIQDNRFTVKIASKGSLQNLALKREFIKKEFPSFNMDNFIGMEGTHFGKEELEGWAVIDDVIANLNSAIGVKHKILYANRGILDCEWNKDYVNHDFHVCTSVKELCDKIIELYRFDECTEGEYDK